MEILHLSITKQDIELAASYKLPPLLFVLVRDTNTLWRISECGTALELIAPHRTFVLPPDVRELWQQFRHTGCTEPHQFTVECRQLDDDTIALRSCARA